jgi:hypothetical protein
MSSAERLQQELADLAELLVPLDDDAIEEWSPEWMSRQSLLTRDTRLRHELAIVQGEFEFEVALSGERVHGAAVEASFFGRFLDELQATVNAVGQAIMFGSLSGAGRRYPAEVLNAASMRLVATQPGSFVMGLAGPERDRQLSFGDEDGDEALPVFDEAVSRVLDVIDVAENEIAGESLPYVVSELGGHRPLTHMVNLAKLLASNGTTAVAVDRSPFRAVERQAVLTAPGARRLQALLSRTNQATETRLVNGKLTGVRWKSGVFDLETDDEGEIISGKIASELRDEVRELFDSPARMTIEVTTTQTEIEGETTTTYKLVEIESRPRPRRRRPPGTRL